MEHIHKFYTETYDEEQRLVNSKQSKIEFITTTKYLDKYLSNGMKILDVGAGTGKYSLHYANKGFKVSAIELVQKNIDIFKSKLRSDMEIDINKGDARDLSIYSDDSFDFLFLFGPLYHLGSDEDKDKCLTECLRVLKPGGFIAIAYINRNLVFVNEAHRFPQETLTEQMYNQLFVTKETKLFYFMTVEEVEKMMLNYPITKKHHLTTDGIGELISESINNMNEEQYKIWLKYHLNTCENNSVLGYGMHNLYMAQKNKY